jgi:hypothetical protein
MAYDPKTHHDTGFEIHYADDTAPLTDTTI